MCGELNLIQTHVGNRLAILTPLREFILTVSIHDDPPRLPRLPLLFVSPLKCISICASRICSAVDTELGKAHFRPVLATVMCRPETVHLHVNHVSARRTADLATK